MKPQGLPLFIDAEGARDTTDEIRDALLRIRAAKRYVCKAESQNGQRAHRDLHEAESALERALAKLGAR